MLIRTKARIAISAMMYLAAGPSTVYGLAGNINVSGSYLEQIFARLRAARLVEGVRGPGGGYRLARPAEDITVADIVAAAFQPTLPSEERSAVYRITSDLDTQVRDYMHTITLATLAQRLEEAA